MIRTMGLRARRVSHTGSRVKPNRVLRPELTMEQGVKLAADSIYACLPYAEERDVTLILS